MFLYFSVNFCQFESQWIHTVEVPKVIHLATIKQSCLSALSIDWGTLKTVVRAKRLFAPWRGKQLCLFTHHLPLMAMEWGQGHLGCLNILLNFWEWSDLDSSQAFDQAILCAGRSQFVLCFFPSRITLECHDKIEQTFWKKLTYQWQHSKNPPLGTLNTLEHLRLAKGFWHCNWTEVIAWSKAFPGSKRPICLLQFTDFKIKILISLFARFLWHHAQRWFKLH